MNKSTQICIYCQAEKDSSLFLEKTKRSPPKSICFDCRSDIKLKNKKYMKEYRAKNYKENKKEIIDKQKQYLANLPEQEKLRRKQKRSEKAKIYRQKPETKERQKTKSKEWRQKNRDKVLKRVRAYKNKKYISDPIFKLSIKVRGAIRHIMSGKKCKKTIEYTGCASFEDLLLKMNEKTQVKDWFFQGLDLDHIWQIHWFDFECEEIDNLYSVINHHSNLRPLDSELNKKRSHIDFYSIELSDFQTFKPFLKEEIIRKLNIFISNKELFPNVQFLLRGTPDELLVKQVFDNLEAQ